MPSQSPVTKVSDDDVCVLVIDDDAAVGRALKRILERAGVSEVTVYTDAMEALRDCEEVDFDAILLDIHMPEVDGFDVMRSLVELVGPDDFAPILVLTGDQRVDVRERALASGARDFVQKPFEPTEVVARLRNLVNTRRMHLRLRSFNDELTARVEQRTADVVSAKLELLDRLARAGEYRDDQTGLHAARVGKLSGVLATELDLGEDQVDIIQQAAPLHDIGKIGIPDGILLKAGPLTDEEFFTMRRHTRIGGAILSGSRFALLQTAERIALSHHEFWDGRGYPHGTAGDDIPVEGRIVAVADAFDSMTHDRPYREHCSVKEAIEEILRCRARQFDPDVVDALLRLYRAGALPSVATSTRRPARSRELAEGAGR